MSSNPLLELQKVISSHKEILSFFKQYSNIEKETLISKALDIQSRAASIHRYRCISTFRFLIPRISYNSFYNELLKEKKDISIIDIGCGLGQDLRKIALDGFPQQNLYGLDLQSEFIELGYELFNDKNTNKMHFIIGNILDKSFFKALTKQRKFNIVYSSSVIHLLNKEDISLLLNNIREILYDKGLFFGQTTGLKNPQEFSDSSGKFRFLHSPESLQKELEFAGFKNVKLIIKESESLSNSETRDTFYFFCEKN